MTYLVIDSLNKWQRKVRTIENWGNCWQVAHVEMLNVHINLHTITGIVPSFFSRDPQRASSLRVKGARGASTGGHTFRARGGTDPRLSEGSGQKVACPVMKVSLNQSLLNTNHSLLKIRFPVSYTHMPESAHVGGRVRYFIKKLVSNNKSSLGFAVNPGCQPGISYNPSTNISTKYTSIQCRKSKVDRCRDSSSFIETGGPRVDSYKRFVLQQHFPDPKEGRGVASRDKFKKAKCFLRYEHFKLEGIQYLKDTRGLDGQTRPQGCLSNNKCIRGTQEVS